MTIFGFFAKIRTKDFFGHQFFISFKITLSYFKCTKIETISAFDKNNNLSFLRNDFFEI